MSVAGAPVESVREFMERVWNEPKPKNTRMRIFRGQAQAQPWKLLPNLFRDETMSVAEMEELENALVAAFYEQRSISFPQLQTTNSTR